MTSTHITNTATTHNTIDGMDLSEMSNTYMTNMTTAYNGMSGMSLALMDNTHNNYYN